MTATYRDRILEHDIRIAYAAAVQGKPRPIRLAELRTQVDASRIDIDRVLSVIATRDDVHLHSEADQKILTTADRDAAIVLGGTARHTLLIED